MFKKAIFLFFIWLAWISFPVSCCEGDFITYEWLINYAQSSAYVDHIAHFRRLFNTIQIERFLECGCGYSTKYFIDRCQEVISIEFMTPEVTDVWMNRCCALYKECPNWKLFVYNRDLHDESFNNACWYQRWVQRDYALIDSRYLTSLHRYFGHLIKEGDIDIAFVDPGIYIRGDLVNIFLSYRIPIIVAHDTQSNDCLNDCVGRYGWCKIRTPINYEKIDIPWGKGTTFWVNKNLSHVVRSLKEYRNLILQNSNNLSYEQLTKIADQL